MEKNKQEFLQNVCNLYIIVLLSVLPLYTQGTYWRLGDTKYLLFRNVSIVCFGIWLIAEGYCLGSRLLQRGQLWGTAGAQRSEGKNGKAFWKGFSTVDWFVLSYGIVCVISFLASSYRETAWTGYRDWYMGTFSQLLFVGIYFFVSRYASGSPIPVYFGEAALFFVTLIGLLQRLKLDPLGLLPGFEPGDWEYSHMLSTVGNINWLCGYYSVVLGLAVAEFLHSSKRWTSALFYLVSVLSLLLLWIQGSASGILLALSCAGLCLLLGLRKIKFFERGILLLGGMLLSLAVMSALITLRKSMGTVPGDGGVREIISWGGWWLAGAAMLAFYAILKRMPLKKRQLSAKIFLLAVGLIGLTVVLVLLSTMKWDNSWGTGRGALWRLSWEGFWQLDFLHKLVGAGPDCFAEYIYTVFPAKEIISQRGHWANSIFTNAHNEWLNHLVNLGVLGVTTYLGIFIAGFRRYKRMELGIFALALYGINSIISFQQVVSTPLLFAVLGICEGRIRRGKLKEPQQDQISQGKKEAGLHEVG